MKLEELHSVHMLGIGGIGMSALARYFIARGVRVSGYDRVRSEMTEALEREGAEIHFEDDPSRIPGYFMNTPSRHALLVHSLAIGRDNAEWTHLEGMGYRIMNRAQLLAAIASGYKCIAVAGTHGKTTTACLLTSLLKECGFPCHALLGGVSADLGSNVHLEGEADHLIVEADEYARSFLELDPDIGVVTAMEEDHMDVYGDRSGLREAFFEFQRKVPESGKLFLEESVPEGRDLKLQPYRYGFGPSSELRIRNVRPVEGAYAFDLAWKDEEWTGLTSRMPGPHNVLDLSAAIAVSVHLGIGETPLRKAMDRIQGVRRRFEFRYENRGRVLIDDYAHHPSELRAVIRTARELYPGKRICGIFQPHLFSRTRDHAEGFASALSELDRLFLLPVYPAREEAIPGVSSEMILEGVEGAEGEMVEKGEALLERVREVDPGVLMVLGAGDVADEVEGLEGVMREMTEKEKRAKNGS
jgi:UDP-N-acetylmuramate--alanine ligase